MFDLLRQFEWARGMLALVVIVTVACQTVLYQLIQTRYGLQLVDRGMRRIFEAAVLGFLLCQAISLAQIGLRLGAAQLDQGLRWERWLGWCLIAVAVLAGRRVLRPVESISMVAITAVTLPPFDRLPEPLPAVLAVGVLLCLCGRAIWLGLVQWKLLRTGISAMSVQEAIDKLPSGLMFVRPDAGVVLINARMRQVMAAMTGRLHRHAEGFLTEALSGTPAEDVDRSELDEAPVFGMADGTHWMVRSTDLLVDGTMHEQVVAIDVSEQWAKVEHLRATHDALEASAWQLQAEIDGLYEACKADELVRFRLRVHDLIGQRVAIMMRLLREGVVPDRDDLVAMVAGLRAELETQPARSEPADELELLRSVMADSGVSVLGPAALPPDAEAAALVIDIIREAVSNAIKHGSATEVRVDCRRVGDVWTMEICNNGFTYATEIVEGDGLRGMRYRLSEFGGTLQVEAGPRFCLHVSLGPRGQ